MATRSTIAVSNADGTYTAIYCHWDGYPDNNGRILVDNYTTDHVVNQLIQLGALSVLGPEIGERHEFNTEQPNWCKAYGRDRGEDDTAAQTYSSLEELLEHGEEYVYIWQQNPETNNKAWHCYDPAGKEIGLDCYVRTAA